MWEWLLLAGVMLMGAMIPGANMALVMRNTLQGSARQGIITALGLACALSIHVLLSVVGLAALINQTPAAYEVIRWLGCAYLLYMGASFLLSSKSQSNDQAPGGSRHPFFAGLLVSLLNPKVLLMFVALFSQVLQGQQDMLLKALYAATPVVMEFGWLMLVIFLLSRPAVQAKLNQLQGLIERLIGGTLLLLGLKIGLS